MTETYRRRVLFLLLLTYISNLVDRQIIGVLAVPIKTDLALTDTQLGLLGGLAFAIFYVTLSIPIAWLADRKSRVTIIAVSVGLWCAFTAACGLAQNFWQLFLARVAVGIGEAGGVAPAHSLIMDYFPLDRRARAVAIFALGVPIGSALGTFFGGWIATNLSWRAAFVIVGLPTLILVPLVKFGIAEPVRGGSDALGRQEASPNPPTSAIVGRLAKSPSFWLLSCGAAAANIPSYALAFWLPSFFRRSFGFDLLELSMFHGSILLLGGCCGIWLGGWLADRAAKGNPSSYAFIPAIAFLLAGPGYAVAMFAPSLTAAWFLFLVPQALGLVWMGPVITAVQHIVPPNMRAIASASFLFINNGVGLTIGTLLVGALSDRLTAAYGSEGLGYSIICSLILYPVGCGLYLLAARRLDRDWYRPNPVSDTR